MDLDSYQIEINRATNGVDRSSDDTTLSAPELSFNDESDLGGTKAKATENIQFGSIVPNTMLLSDSTSATGQIRTITGTSVNGSKYPSWIVVWISRTE